MPKREDGKTFTVYEMQVRGFLWRDTISCGLYRLNFSTRIPARQRNGPARDGTASSTHSMSNSRTSTPVQSVVCRKPAWVLISPYTGRLSLPPKRAFNNLSRDFLEKRYSALEVWLASLLKDELLEQYLGIKQVTCDCLTPSYFC